MYKAHSLILGTRKRIPFEKLHLHSHADLCLAIITWKASRIIIYILALCLYDDIERMQRMQENLLHIMKGTYVTGLGNSVGMGCLRINPFGFQGETAVSDSDTCSQCLLSEKDRRPLLSGHALNPHILLTLGARVLPASYCGSCSQRALTSITPNHIPLLLLRNLDSRVLFTLSDQSCVDHLRCENVNLRKC